MEQKDVAESFSGQLERLTFTDVQPFILQLTHHALLGEMNRGEIE